MVLLALGPGGFTLIFGRMALLLTRHIYSYFKSILVLHARRRFIKASGTYLHGDEDTVPI
jgi:hypothetical protein